MSTRYGLPTEAELRRLTRRKLVGLAIGLAVAAALCVVLALTIDGVRASTVLFFVAGALFLGNLLTTGDPSPGEMSRREVLTAGSRRRRRRLRWSLLRGRTDDLDDDDRRICHYLVPVVRVRAWTLLLLNLGSLPAAAAYTAGQLARNPPPDPSPLWVSLLLGLLVVLVLATVADLCLRVAELRAAGRYLAAEAR